MGSPLTETQPCNMTENTDMCSYHWGFLDNEWSTCISDNHYCGNGTQWRRQRCLDQKVMFSRMIIVSLRVLLLSLIPATVL